MSVTSLFDASELTAFADKLLSKGVARRAAITMVVKKGAQNVKNDIREDLSGSGNKAFRRIPITRNMWLVPQWRDSSAVDNDLVEHDSRPCAETG